MTVITITDVLYKPHHNKEPKPLGNTQREKNLSIAVEKIIKSLRKRVKREEKNGRITKQPEMNEQSDNGKSTPLNNTLHVPGLSPVKHIECLNI